MKKEQLMGLLMGSIESPFIEKESPPDDIDWTVEGIRKYLERCILKAIMHVQPSRLDFDQRAPIFPRELQAYRRQLFFSHLRHGLKRQFGKDYLLDVSFKRKDLVIRFTLLRGETPIRLSLTRPNPFYKQMN